MQPGLKGTVPDPPEAVRLSIRVLEHVDVRNLVSCARVSHSGAEDDLVGYEWSLELSFHVFDVFGISGEVIRTPGAYLDLHRVHSQEGHSLKRCIGGTHHAYFRAQQWEPGQKPFY